MGDGALAELLRSEGIRDERVLSAVASLDRSLFVPEHAEQAQGNYPLPIGFGQTISQPYIVAFMTEALELTGEERVLEIGTGSGYQAAVLARLCHAVYTVEILPPLARRAARVLGAMGFTNVFLREGDGFLGWPEAAPFDAIVLTAAPAELPHRLVEQLSPGGRLVAPVGRAGTVQELVLVERGAGDGVPRIKSLMPVQFVPMTGASP